MKGDRTMINDDQNTTTSLDLAKIREDIDSVDQQIQQLINRRARLAEAVAKAKFASEENPLFYRPEREAQVLRNVMERNEGPLSDTTKHCFLGTSRDLYSFCGTQALWP